MRLAPGEAFDRYTIEAFLGEGGMGQVYRAHDSKLHRRVALKLLLIDDAAADAGRSTGKARLLREARAVAGLDHPNAIAVFDVGEVAGAPFIAMEFVDGKPLRALIDERATPLTTRLRWLGDVARALAAAHKQGIVHRDVKPENIMVRADGVLKVLDFGIARRIAAQPLERTAVAGSALGTLTATGAVVGTPLYMSPEQMRGEDIDGRSDQFAWGVVAYEVLTGRPPWQGAEPLVVVAQILMDDPRELRAIAPEVPVHVGAAIMRTLGKRPDDRFAGMDDLLAALERPAVTAPPPPEPSAPAPRTSEPAPAPTPVEIPTMRVATSPSRPGRGLAIAAAVLTALAAGWFAHRVTARRSIATTTTTPPPPAALPALLYRQVVLATDEPGPDLYPSLSPDGTWFVYARRVGASWDVFRRRIGGGNPQNLTADRADVDDTQPSISPDAERIAFRSERDGGGIFVMGATGESLRRLSDFGYDPTWTGDAREVIVGSWPSSFKYPASQTLWAIDVATGARRRIYPLDPAAPIDASGTPSASPRNHRVAWWGGGLWTAARDGTAVVRLTDGPDVGPMWTADGRAIWFMSLRAGSPALWRIAIDEASGRALGPPELVMPGLGAILKLGGFSRDGRRFIFSATTGRSTIEKVKLDAGGDVVTGVPITLGFGRDPVVRGDRVAFHMSGHVHVMSRDGSGRRQLSDGDGVDTHPSWSADGATVLFTSTRGGATAAWAIGADGSGLRQAVELSGASNDAVAGPDGRRLAVGAPGGALIVSTAASSEVLDHLPAPAGPGTVFRPRAWSADGTLLAGDIDRVDGAVGGVAVWSTADRTLTIASKTGAGAAWLRGGRRLLTLDGPSLVVHDLATARSHAVYTVPHGGLGETVSVTDDGWVFYTREAYDADIWMVEFEPGLGP